MPMMCEECKCSNWYCANCGDSTHHDCDCSCCGCACQRQDSTALAVQIDNQPTERSNTMTTEAPVVTPDQQQIVYLKEQNAALDKRIEALMLDLTNSRSIIDEHRRKVSKLFTKLNDYIEEGDYDEDGDINLSELDDMLSSIFSNRLVFEKLYEVQITYTIDATFEIRAKDEDAAREIAEEIGICEDPRFDHEEDPTECAIDQSRVGYLQRKGI